MWPLNRDKTHTHMLFRHIMLHQTLRWTLLIEQYYLYINITISDITLGDKSLSYLIYPVVNTKHVCHSSTDSYNEYIT